MNEPLTPVDCDLQDFAYMPLDVRRLRDSDLAATESPEACWAAVLLWAASWHQVPAASLPDDDRVLSNLAGYGRVVKEWQRVKDGALRGWVKCSDGRLYHPVVAEKANESWASKLKHAYGKMMERTRKVNKARAEKHLSSIDVPTFDEWNSTGRLDPVPAECAQTSTGTDDSSGGKNDSSAGIPPENALKGEGEGEGKGYIKEIQEQSSSSVGVGVCASPPDPSNDDDDDYFLPKDDFLPRTPDAWACVLSRRWSWSAAVKRPPNFDELANGWTAAGLTVGGMAAVVAEAQRRAGAGGIGSLPVYAEAVRKSLAAEAAALATKTAAARLPVNPADVARCTVPGKPGRDPTLLRIEAEDAKAVPPPPDVRAKLAALSGRGRFGAAVGAALAAAGLGAGTAFAGSAAPVEVAQPVAGAVPAGPPVVQARNGVPA